jgi:endonuclease/exonuclease/phosphatase family metal-dependent hydrolase
MRVATWNLQRHRPDSAKGQAALAHLRSLDADIVILTEAWTGHLGDDFHHVDAGLTGTSHLHRDERKVVVGSRWSIRDLSTNLDVPTPGRFVSAIVDTPSGSLRVIGVCIPWYASRVRSGEARNWADFQTFLTALQPILESHQGMPCVVAGDFNLKLPASDRNRDQMQRLHAAFSGFHIATTGARPETGRSLIDHIAISPGLSCDSVKTWSRVLEGLAVSDHDGVMVDLE